MTRLSRVFCMLTLAGLVSGCSSLPAMPQIKMPELPRMGEWSKDWRICAGIGGVVGGAAGATRDRSIAVAGAVVGGLLGTLVCGKENWSGQPTSTGPIPAEADSDGDGVPDRLDRCPNTPPGVKVDASGCAVGVARGEEPRTPSPAAVASQSVVELQALPAVAAPAAKDSEKVADAAPAPAPAAEPVAEPAARPDPAPAAKAPAAATRCPGVPAGVQLDKDGCPLPGTMLLRSEVHFATRGLELAPASREVIDEIVKVMRTDTRWLAEVSGHTDDVGGATANRVLSQKRAEVVRDYLVAKGIAASRLTVHGYGQAMPMADNNTEAGRSANRRVEIKVRAPGVAAPAAKSAAVAPALERPGVHLAARHGHRVGHRHHAGLKQVKLGGHPQPRRTTMAKL